MALYLKKIAISQKLVNRFKSTKHHFKDKVLALMLSKDINILSQKL